MPPETVSSLHDRNLSPESKKFGQFRKPGGGEALGCTLTPTHDSNWKSRLNPPPEFLLKAKRGGSHDVDPSFDLGCRSRSCAPCDACCPTSAAALLHGCLRKIKTGKSRHLQNTRFRPAQI